MGKNGSNVFKNEIKFNGSSTMAPLVSALASDFTKNNVKWDKVDLSLPPEAISIKVSSESSKAGLESILKQTSDLGLLSKEINATEKDKIGAVQEYVLALDALTISVNPNNPLAKLKDTLSAAEIMKIFSGEYKYWNELDNRLENKEIIVVTRSSGGGANDVFQEKIMGNSQIRKDGIQANSMDEMMQKIIDNKCAIGYISLGVLKQNEGKLIPIKVDNIQATERTIRDGSYKISRPLSVVKNGAFSPEQEAFLNYALSPKGAKIIGDMGFVVAD